MNRSDMFARLHRESAWDLVVIGGGATGLGIALDAVQRGYSVALLEAQDFAKGASSRATKLLHGGVRYLAQGNIRLVHEALHERAVILRNAPHLAQRLSFVIPAYSQWERLRYGVGLTAYSLLAGARSLGPTQWLTPRQTIAALPTVRQDGLVGGIRYWDAQFDDARLAIALARTAQAHGAVLLNYCAVKELLHERGHVAGVVCEDQETGTRHTVRARCVVNATGVWSDALRRADKLHDAPLPKDRVQPSRGAHIVLDKSFLPSGEALMVPSTSDGRVLFAIPWQGKLLAGTTDVPTHTTDLDPVPGEDEIAFILRELGRYLVRQPSAADILSQWAGLRPLVRPDADAVATQGISREHDILVSATGMVSVTGGKWTTYRVIASDTLDTCISAGLLAPAGVCHTAELPLVGAASSGAVANDSPLARYGSEGATVHGLPGGDTFIGPGLTEAMVRFAVRYEYARTVDDVLARRIRLLFLDARLAGRCAARVDEILQEEGVADTALAAFEQLVEQYAHTAT